MSTTEIKFFTYAEARKIGRTSSCDSCAYSVIEAGMLTACKHPVVVAEPGANCVDIGCAGGAFLEVPVGPSPVAPAPEAEGTQAPPAPLSGPQGAVKHDDGKPRMDLLPPEALREIALVLSFGAQKYASHNWRKGLAYSRLIAACLRHLFAWVGREDKDPESGRSHLAHAACCLLFLITFEQTNTGDDDRYTDKEQA